ncbi:integrase core domain-containing protein, partial [Nocardia aurantiaca]
GRFDTCTCMPISKDLPSSPQQHGDNKIRAFTSRPPYHLSGHTNAWAESFNGTLKNERVNRTQYPTREHARKDITRYIELRYNQIRLHSGIDYHTPNEVESEWFQRNQAA